jgi:hypothetical protein
MNAIDWFLVLDAIIVLALAIVAVTPTKADDDVVGRIVNLIRLVIPKRGPG